jgi:hypothetical protein
MYNIEVNNNQFLLDELLDEIFLFIPYRDVIRNISLVNKQCHNVMFGYHTTHWNRVCQNQSINFPTKDKRMNYIEKYKTFLSFVQKYRISNISILCCNERLLLLEFIILIEPFVTKLAIGGSDELYLLFIKFYKTNVKYEYPNLKSLYLQSNPGALREWFGTDLSRFKELKLSRSFADGRWNSHRIDQFTFGSLETINMYSVDTMLYSIIAQNRTTLRKVNLIQASPITDFNPFNQLSATLHTLQIRVDTNIKLSKPLIFNELKKVEFQDDYVFILPFFTVSHPLLTDITLIPNTVDNYELKANIDLELAKQPSVKYLMYEGPVEIYNNMLEIVSTTVETLVVGRCWNEASFNSSIKLPKLRAVECYNFWKVPGFNFTIRIIKYQS